MQTNFTEKQLKDSDNAATEKVFKQSLFTLISSLNARQKIENNDLEALFSFL